MSAWKFTGAGYQYNGESGDHSATCECCTQHFEAPTAALAAAAAQNCADNDRRGSDLFDTTWKP